MIKTGFVIALAAVLVALLAGCTSEPLISRHGVSDQAVRELGRQAVTSLTVYGKQEQPDTATTYIAGFIPVSSDPISSRPSDVLFVDGRERGHLPLVTTLRKPGPHRIRIEIPVFEPFHLTLADPIRLRTPRGDIEAWPPIILYPRTGEVFTTLETPGMDVDRNSGSRKKTDIAKKAGRDPLLIATTTDKPDPKWRKIGQMRVSGTDRRN